VLHDEGRGGHRPARALRDSPHPTHFSVSDALALIEEVAPRRAVLTNLHTDLRNRALAASSIVLTSGA
jgi:phosphoribosyl 1,2-cyclic phosphodiesterase